MNPYRIYAAIIRDGETYARDLLKRLKDVAAVARQIHRDVPHQDEIKRAAWIDGALSVLFT